MTSPGQYKRCSKRFRKTFCNLISTRANKLANINQHGKKEPGPLVLSFTDCVAQGR